MAIFFIAGMREMIHNMIYNESFNDSLEAR